MSVIDDVRDHVGDTPDNDAITDAVDRFANVDHQVQRAALSILRRRRANLDGDRSFSVAGDASWGAVAVANLQALDAKIAALRRVIGGDETPMSTLPVMTTTPIRGPDVRRVGRHIARH